MKNHLVCKVLLCLFLSTAFTFSIHAQIRVDNANSVIVGGSAVDGALTADPSAKFEINVPEGQKLGFLKPRLAESDMVQIQMPAVGLEVFNTTRNTTYYYTGTLSGISGWVPYGEGEGMDDQNLTSATLNGTYLTIEIENGDPVLVNLASLESYIGSDNQNMGAATLNGTELTIDIENGQPTIVDLADLLNLAVGDNLGNHIATENIKLNDNWISNDGDDEGIKIDFSGNVGIGTANPQYPLTIKTHEDSRIVLSQDVYNYAKKSPKLSFFAWGENGQITGPSIQKSSTGAYGTGNLGFIQHPLGDYSTEVEVMTITPTGNVGIGTTSPSKNLHVVRNAVGIEEAAILVENTDVFGGAGFQMIEAGGGNWKFKTIQGNGGFKIRDHTASADRIVILNDGKVGIGTSDPSSKLDVVGELEVSKRGGTATKIAGWDNSNKSVDIKIGNGLKLADGKINAIDGDITNELQNLVFDGNTTLSITNGNSVDLSALQNDPNAWNIAGNTNSENNVLGTLDGNSLRVITNGDERLEIDTVGRLIPKFNNSDNIVIGAYTGNTGMEGTGNIVAGDWAGSGMEGFRNSYFGNRSGWGATGNFNVYLGNLAGSFVQDAGNNVFIGHKAGYSSVALTKGDNNVVIGSNSGSTTEKFANSVLLGSEITVISGGDDDIANNSVAIGHGAILNGDHKVYLHSGNDPDQNIVGQICGDADFTNCSDERFKTSVKEDVMGLEMILGLRPVSYQFDYKKYMEHLVQELPRAEQAEMLEGYSYANEKTPFSVGFIAQEVDELVTNLDYEFSGLHKPNPKNVSSHYSIAYSSIVVPLVKAVQEQQVLIETQDSAIKAQDTTIKNQKTELQELKNTLDLLIQRVKKLEEN